MSLFFRVETDEFETAWMMVYRCTECGRVYDCCYSAKGNDYVCRTCGSHPLERIIGQRVKVAERRVYFGFFAMDYKELSVSWSFRPLNNAKAKYT